MNETGRLSIQLESAQLRGTQLETETNRLVRSMTQVRFRLPRHKSLGHTHRLYLGVGAFADEAPWVWGFRGGQFCQKHTHWPGR